MAAKPSTGEAAMAADLNWLDSCRRLRAIAQTGLAYSRDPYDRDRFQELRLIAERMLAWLSDAHPDRVAEVFLPERGYPTPKIDVRAGVFRGDSVLLVKERADGRWALPGGWGDEGDSPRSSIEREVLEESGYEVRAARLVAIKDRHLHPYEKHSMLRVYKLFFLCDLLGGEPRASLETESAEFFPITRLPELSLGRTLPDDVHLLNAYRAEPDRDVYLD